MSTAKKKVAAVKVPPRYIEIGQATIMLPDALVTLLASYRVVMAPKRYVAAVITVTTDAVEPLSRKRINGVRCIVAKRNFPFGGKVAQDFAEVAAGNWLFERFTCAFQVRGQQ